MSPKYYTITDQNTVETLAPSEYFSPALFFKPVTLMVIIGCMDMYTFKDTGRLSFMCFLLASDKSQFSISVVKAAAAHCTHRLEPMTFPSF